MLSDTMFLIICKYLILAAIAGFLLFLLIVKYRYSLFQIFAHCFVRDCVDLSSKYDLNHML